MRIHIYVSAQASVFVYVSMCMRVWLCLYMRTYAFMPMFSCLSPIPACIASCLH